MAGPPVRQRYNAKARGSVAGGGSHKKRKRGPSRQGPSEDGDEEVQGGFGAGMSSKKKKRLESYIAKKLKSEERLKTLQLLASLAPESGTSAGLLSSSTLGQNPFAPTSAKERFEKKEDRVVRKEMSRLRRKGLRSSDEDDGSSSEEDVREEYEGKGSRGMDKGKGRAMEPPAPLEDAEKKLHDISKNKQRKARRSKAAKWNPSTLSTQPHSSSSEFDSSASDNDSGNEEDDQPVAGPSRSPSPPPPPPPPPATIVEIGSRKAAPMGVGGALKKSADGNVAQPRIVVRRPKRLRAYPRDDEGGEEGGSSEEEDEDERDGEASRDASGGEGGDISDEDESEDEEESDESQDPPVKKRALGFKDWALKQMGQAPSPDVSRPIPVNTLKPVPKSADPSIPKPPHFGPLGEALSIPSSSLLDAGARQPSRAKPSTTRRPSVSASRMDLPILAEEQPIVEAIRLHPVVVICGETGSGKTTQVPQMLYEAGFGYKGGDDPGMIAVTQPRRVAAVSLALRVRDELGFTPTNPIVAHQIRYSSTTSPETAIKFMTDGVLLRELASDFLLSRYSVIIVDEAHERGVNTDVLIGVLSRVAKLREKRWRDQLDAGDAIGKKVKPLRIVIMSATLRVNDFTENPTLFATPPPVIHIGARQHPVTVHFSRRTVADYPTEAFKKVCKIHARLPPGGILVFMTGQAEIQALCRKLEKKYGSAKAVNGSKAAKDGRNGKPKEDTSNDLPPEGMLQLEHVLIAEREAEDVELGQDEDLAADVDDGDALSDAEALDTEDEDNGDFDIEEDTSAPLHVLPLYSLLSHDQQMAVFKPPPEGHRLVIVATNVAETSLTIPGIRYVVDTGRAKERGYDHSSGVQSFSVSWISKASASQRAGRAGRTGPGHCYRLYSSAIFEDHFQQFSDPEILRMPIEGVVLQMKSMAIDQVVNFPFPTPPDRQALRKAEKLLTSLGALSAPVASRLVNGVPVEGSGGGQITDLGRLMAGYPVSPRFAKMLVIGNQHGCLPYVIAVVACLSVGDPFIHEQSLELENGADSEDEEDDDRRRELEGIRSDEIRAKEDRKDLRRKYFKAQSVFTALGGGSSDMFKLLSAIGAYEFDPTPTFCSRSFLRLKAMQEIAQLRRQISSIAKVPLAQLTPPNETQLKVIRQILTAGFIDQLAVRVDIAMKKGGASYTSCRNVAYRASGVGNEDIYIHPSSSLFHGPPTDWVTWTEVTRSQSRGEGLGKAWMKGITSINPAWISTLGKDMCSWSRPMELPGKKAVIKGDERDVALVPHLRDLGVDLPAVKRKQRREGTRWVLLE